MARFFTEKITPEQLAEKIWNACCESKDIAPYGYSSIREAMENGKNYPDEKSASDYEKYMDKCYCMGLPLLSLEGKPEKDMQKVEFDWENSEFNPDHAYHGLKKITGFNTLENGLSFLGFYAGGDWEEPVYGILYWDGKDIRAYIPKDGNLWNTDTNRAYGNGDDYDEDEDLDFKNIKKRWPEIAEGKESYGDLGGKLEYDQDAILRDIVARIQYKEL